MYVYKGLRSMMRQRVWSKMGQDMQARCVGLGQRRNYRHDDRYTWPNGLIDGREGRNISGSEMRGAYTEEGFDPRYDDQHYRSYERAYEPSQSETGHQFWNSSTNKDTESRRRISLDTLDHQRRQEQIIQENKRRWQHRSEPAHPAIDYKFYAAGPGRQTKKGDGADEAKKYSKQRRLARQKEVKRQARELRESRKNYNLPGYNRPTQDEVQQEEPKAEVQQQLNMKYASRAWLEKRAQEEEEKYWHSWSSCPCERPTQEAETGEDANEFSDDNAPSYKPNKPRGFVKPPHSYDGSVRSYQTHSQLPALRPPQYAMSIKKAPRSRNPTGMEKQYMLARDYSKLSRKTKDNYKLPISLLQSHVFKTSPTAYGKHDTNVDPLADIGLPEQTPRMKLAWHGLPRPIYKRFHGIQKAVAKQRIQPPRFRMTVKSTGLKRKRTPIDSFSDQLAVNTKFTPHSEYLGYGRQTVCDAWQFFSNVHNLRPIY